MKLYETTIELLKARGKYRNIADQTGLDYDWICSISQGRIKDPGVKKMQALYDYLTNDEAA